MRRSALLVALLSAGLLSVGLAGPVAAGASTHRASTHRAPTDWELAGRGAARASFAEASAGQKRTIEDLTVQAPITCANSPTPAVPIDVEVISARVALSRAGDFSTGAIRHGAGTSVSGRIVGRRVTLRYRHVTRTPNDFDGTTEVCNTGSVRLSGTPGHRVNRSDKEWRGQTLTSEPVALDLVAGGRALEEPAHPPADGSAQASIAFGAFTQSCGVGTCTPSSADICAYATTQTLFVASDGTFGNTAWQEGDQAVFTGRFTGAGAVQGTFTNGAEGCATTTWTASAG